MQDSRRQMLMLLVVSLLVGGGYMAYTMFFAPAPSRPAQSAPTATPAPREEPTPDDGDGEGDAGSDQADSIPTVDPGQRLEQQQTAVLRGDGYVATVTNLNAALTRVELTSTRWTDVDGSPMEMVTTDQEQYLPLRTDLGGVSIPPDAVWQMEQTDERSVRLRWEGNGFRVVRTLEVGEGPYQLWSTLSITNTGSRARPVRVSLWAYHYVRREDESGGFIFASPSPKISHGLCVYGDGEVLRRPHPDDDDPALHEGYGTGVRIVGVENSYFATAMVASGEAAERCQIHIDNRGGSAGEPDGSLFEARLVYPRTEVGVGETTTVRTLAYIGPKDSDALSMAGHGLRVVIDRGWFSVVAEYLVALLSIIYGFVGNWGLAIILMTILVRIALFPLTWKSFQSMARMRVLKPEMDRVNELYKDDREKKGAAVMELYRKHKINPLGGCLPQLLQMPVWFAFYASLSTNVELYHANFGLWWTDLSAPDPYYALPLVLGALMFVQQKIMPTTMDAAQAKIMMYFMPIMITSFMLFLPAGLCLYMVTNSVLGIAQQQMIHRQLNRESAAAKAKEAAAARESEADDGDDDDEDDADRSQVTSVVSRTKPNTRSRTRKTARRRSRRAR